MTDIRRGYVHSDDKEFSIDKIAMLKEAQEDLLFLLDRGYPIKSASTFVGNHYMLSERQRLAIVRASAAHNILDLRKLKCLSESEISGSIVNMDGLNVIITLEVALSDSTLLRCMDETIRDLAGLRGTYRLIDKTDIAIRLIGDKLAKMNVKGAVIYLDAPVSNTGRLKSKILYLLENYPFEVKVELVQNPDLLLEVSENVISSDAIILNKCKSWINLVAEILDDRLPHVTYIDLG